MVFTSFFFNDIQEGCKEIKRSKDPVQVPPLGMTFTLSWAKVPPLYNSGGGGQMRSSFLGFI